MCNYMKYISVLFFIMMSSIVFSQTKFNKIINCERDAMHLLVSVSALEDGYVLLAGTSNVDGYGSNRCSMIIKLDENGNMLYNNFICDSTESVYEGWYNQKIHISALPIVMDTLRTNLLCTISATMIQVQIF